MELSKIYVIRKVEGGAFISINCKAAWTKAGNAKNAFNTAFNYKYLTQNGTPWSLQTEYEIVEIQSDGKFVVHG